MKIYDDIEKERQAALKKVPDDFEANNTLNDYIAFTTAYLGRAADGVFRNERENLNQREMLVKAVGLIVTAIERLDNE